jgi:two-component system, chemotaxis family, sensor kinase CheA
MSIRAKILGLVLLLTAAAVSVLVVVLPARHLESIRADQLDKALGYGRQLSRQLEGVVAFDDPETAREVLDGLSRDDEVAAAGVYHQDGRLIQARGEVELEQLSADPARIAVRRNADGLLVVAPIRAREGARGWLVLRLSGERQHAARSQVLRVTALTLGLALALAVAGAFVLAGPIVRRVQAMTRAAEAVAAGDLAADPPKDSDRDELGRLGRAFGHMLAQLRALIDERAEAARTEKERLDKLVDQRTAELAQRQRENQLVLENVSQGVLIAHPDGTLGPEHSHAMVRWFGEVPLGAPFWRYLAAADDDLSFAFELGWDMVKDGFLPTDICLDQLPKTISRDDRSYRLRVTPIAGDAAGRFLLLVEDATDEMARKRAEAESRELTAALGYVSKDRDGFLDFVHEATALVRGITASTSCDPQLKRALHTLKGSAAMFGLDGISATCHELEDRIAETGEPLSRADKVLLETAWGRLGLLTGILDEHASGRIEVERREIGGLIRAIERGDSAARLIARAHGIEMESAQRRLERIATQTRALAAKSGRDGVSVVVDAGPVKIDGEALKGFWTAFPHVVRNAFSHGLEPPEEREAMGKSPSGFIKLSAKLVGDSLLVEASDDGRGIDWERVAKAAAQKGLPHETPADLLNALFADGLSTKASADTMSGRGEGMAAVRAAVEQIGGRVAVQTRASHGTTFEFWFPSQLAAADVGTLFPPAPPS